MRFRLLIDPVPASRPRFVRRGRFTSTYYAGRYKGFLEDAPPLIRGEMEELGGDFPLLGPLRIEAVFSIRKPRTSKLDAPRGDVDNYGKALLDAMQAAEFFKDDNQVIELEVSKIWADTTAGIEVRVQSL